jgi:hypothetical protein
MNKIESFLLDSRSKSDLKKVKGNISEVESYLEQAKTAFEQILNLPKNESVAALHSHIDNFNNIMGAKNAFKMDNIKEQKRMILIALIQLLKIEKNHNY